MDKKGKKMCVHTSITYLVAMCARRRRRKGGQEGPSQEVAAAWPELETWAYGLGTSAASNAVVLKFKLSTPAIKTCITNLQPL